MNGIGIYHQIDLGTLDRAADLAAAGTETSSMMKDLVQFATVLGISRGTAPKRVQVAKRAWCDYDSRIVQQAISLWGKSNSSERLALHIGVIGRTYPFLFEVLGQIGTQMQLTGSVRQDFARARLQRMYGSKANVYQAVQKVFQSLVSWEILGPAQEKGKYEFRPKFSVMADVAELLLAAIMEGRGQEGASLEALRNDPAWFFVQLPHEASSNPLLHQSIDGSGRAIVSRI